jgi:hypothetical protein
MTGCARAASLPDETPVEDLSLRQVTINRLRVGGVLTLGDLRATPDRELMRLRRFGPHALADVRALVPVPAEDRAALPGREVTIAGRSFTLGTVYAPLARVYGHRRRRLLDHDPDSPLPGGRVEVVVAASGRSQVMAGVVWAAWAGEPVEDSPGDTDR